MAKMTMVQALNLALQQEMDKDDSVIVLGEDVGEYLDRCLSIEVGVDGPPYVAHAAFADLVDDAVVQEGLVGFDGHGGLRGGG